MLLWGEQVVFVRRIVLPVEFSCRVAIKPSHFTAEIYIICRYVDISEYASL
jgi:hypothetical protein